MEETETEIGGTERPRCASRITAMQRDALHSEIGAMFKYLAVQPSETLLNDIIDAVLRVAAP